MFCIESLTLLGCQRAFPLAELKIAFETSFIREIELGMSSHCLVPFWITKSKELWEQCTIIDFSWPSDKCFYNPIKWPDKDAAPSEQWLLRFWTGNEERSKKSSLFGSKAFLQYNHWHYTSLSKFLLAVKDLILLDERRIESCSLPILSVVPSAISSK